MICDKCKSEHCGGNCYEKSTWKPCAAGPVVCKCGRPAHYHDSSEGMEGDWCILHAPDRFRVSNTERGRYNSSELRDASWKALHFMREVFLKPSHVPLSAVGVCKDCDEMRRLLFAVAELEQPGTTE